MNKLIGLMIFFIGLCSCKKETDNEHYETYNRFYPLAIGKFITYQLDSTLTTSFGTGFTVRSYTVKDSVEGQLADNENRLSYRVVRYQLSAAQWMPVNTFLVTPLNNRLEYVENNLRIVKLANPVTSDEKWMGNEYINTSPFFPNSDFKTWTYQYINLEKPFMSTDRLLTAALL